MFGNDERQKRNIVRNSQLLIDNYPSFTWHNLGTEGAMRLAEALKHNNNLTYFKLSVCELIDLFHMYLA